MEHDIEDQDDVLTEPTLGDLSMLEDDDLEPKSQHQMGGEELSKLDADSEILGDISLLEEAIAELETDEESAILNSGPATSEAAQTTQNDSQVPTLDEEIDLSTGMAQFKEDLSASHQSIPVLDEVADVQSGVASDSNSDANPFGALLDDSDIGADVPSEIESNQSGPSYPLEAPLSGVVKQSNDTGALEAPIAVAADSSEGSPFDDAATSQAGTASQSEVASQFSTGVAFSSDNAQFSIPQELHTQLSRKIDDLVIEAATSITNELHHQLSLRMENLLNQAMEAVLPSLLEQMAKGLRGEIKEKVKEQLPDIMNDVLQKTRLRDDKPEK